METNVTLYGWWVEYLRENRIEWGSFNGGVGDPSGNDFLRKLLGGEQITTKWGHQMGREAMYDCTPILDVDPRGMAQRVLDVRTQLAAEFIQDLEDMTEENSILFRETLKNSLKMGTDGVEWDD